MLQCPSAQDRNHPADPDPAPAFPVLDLCGGRSPPRRDARLPPGCATPSRTRSSSGGPADCPQGRRMTADSALLRRIPAVDEVLRRPEVVALASEVSPGLLASWVREALDAARGRVLAGQA